MGAREPIVFDKGVQTQSCWPVLASPGEPGCTTVLFPRPWNRPQRARSGPGRPHSGWKGEGCSQAEPCPACGWTNLARCRLWGRARTDLATRAFTSSLSKLGMGFLRYQLTAGAWSGGHAKQQLSYLSEAPGTGSPRSLPWTDGGTENGQASGGPAPVPASLPPTPVCSAPETDEPEGPPLCQSEESPSPLGNPTKP